MLREALRIVWFAVLFRCIMNSELISAKNIIVAGEYDFPVMRKCRAIPNRLLPFNFAKTAKDYDCWLHFFIDDYQFERLWNSPQRYLPLIKKFNGVLAPDFSLFSDMSKSQQIYNCWRNRTLSVWLQDNGVEVIPVIEWSDRKSLEWCLDGIPLNSTIAVQTNGCFKSSATKLSFIKGMDYVYEKLMPTSLVIYGRGSEYKNYFSNVHLFESYCQNLKKRL